MPIEQTPPVTPPQSGRWVTVLIVLVGLTVLAAFSFLKLPFGNSLRLKTCFQDVGGLRPGAEVKVAGVDVGMVRDIRAQPMDKTCPGAVEMVLRTSYELRIPRDSVAYTTNGGVFGPTYLEIDVLGASGPPIQSGGLLPSRESVKFTGATVDRVLKAVELVKQLSDEEKESRAQSPKNPSGVKPPAP